MSKIRTEAEQRLIDAHVARTVANFPPLTDAQADQIAALLRPAAEKMRQNDAQR